MRDKIDIGKLEYYLLKNLLDFGQKRYSRLLDLIRIAENGLIFKYKASKNAVDKAILQLIEKKFILKFRNDGMVYLLNINQIDEALMLRDEKKKQGRVK